MSKERLRVEAPTFIDRSIVQIIEELAAWSKLGIHPVARQVGVAIGILECFEPSLVSHVHHGTLFATFLRRGDVQSPRFFSLPLMLAAISCV